MQISQDRLLQANKNANHTVNIIDRMEIYLQIRDEHHRLTHPAAKNPSVQPKFFPKLQLQPGLCKKTESKHTN
uniref:Uncharacterized protein n=1 Tax=Romanomermis culicivorax TaxID=13658 RepID=A0A915HZJ4_ROMCU